MLIVKKSAGQQRRRRRVRSRPVSEQVDWAIESCDAEFNYLRVHTRGLNACAGEASVIDVTSIDATAEKFISGGGDIVRPKIIIPGVGSLITCRDSVGQIFTFLEEESPVNPERQIFDNQP